MLIIIIAISGWCWFVWQSHFTAGWPYFGGVLGNAVMNADVGTKDRSVKRCPVLLNSKLEVSYSWSPRMALNRTGSARRRDGR